MQSTRRVLSAGAKKGGKPMGTPGKSGFVTEMWAPFSRYWKGIKQARSEDVGLIPSVRGPLTRLMRDTFIKHGELVGEDARGNLLFICFILSVGTYQWEPTLYIFDWTRNVLR